MRHIPDIIIAVGVIVGATGIATGYRWVGGISLAVVLIVGWKRDWCMESFEGMIGSSESSAAIGHDIQTQTSFLTADTAAILAAETPAVEMEIDL